MTFKNSKSCDSTAPGFFTEEDIEILNNNRQTNKQTKIAINIIYSTLKS